MALGNKANFLLSYDINPTLPCCTIDEALRKIELLKANLTDKEKSSKLQGLYDYIKRNKRYVVNYEERQQTNQTYTSQVAESHIESVINARHKKSGKCNGHVQVLITSYKSEL